MTAAIDKDSCTYTIYGMCSPLEDNDIRYIGRTRFSLEKRLKGHLKETHCYYGFKGIWLSVLQDCGLTPTMTPLATTTGFASANRLEHETIRDYVSRGVDLLNSPYWQKHTSRAGAPRYSFELLSDAHCALKGQGTGCSRRSHPAHQHWKMLYFFHTNWPSLDILGLCERRNLAEYVYENFDGIGPLAASASIAHFHWLHSDRENRKYPKTKKAS